MIQYSNKRLATLEEGEFAYLDKIHGRTSYREFAFLTYSASNLDPHPRPATHTTHPLFSFVCSSNNNISRITSMVQNLCTHFSPPLIFDSPAIVEPYCPFPSPHSLANLSVDGALRDLGFGYRAKYIQQTAALLCQTHEDPQQWLLSLRTKSTEEAREELLKLPGVGPKVADCILLMSCDKVCNPPLRTLVFFSQPWPHIIS